MNTTSSISLLLSPLIRSHTAPILRTQSLIPCFILHRPIIHSPPLAHRPRQPRAHNQLSRASTPLSPAIHAHQRGTHAPETLHANVLLFLP